MEAKFVEPVQNISAAHVFESSQMLASRIQEHGFRHLASQGFIHTEFDEATGVLKLQETMPNLATTLFEASGTVQQKIAAQGLENMLAQGRLMQL